MKKRKRKVDRAKNSVYGQGLVASVLFFCATLATTIGHSEAFRKMLDAELYSRKYWIMSVSTAFTTAGLIAVAAHVANTHKKSSQLIRDQQIDSTKPFALYLRPFFSDKSIAIQNPFLSIWPFKGVPPTLGPEEFVGSVLESTIPVRQVGSRSNTVGVARLYPPDRDWQLTVIESIRKASAIVIMPIVRQDPQTHKQQGNATLWELSYLVSSGAISKSVVLMPSRYSIGTKNEVRLGWEHVRSHAMNFGLILPPYMSCGSVLTFEEQDKKWCVKRQYKGSFWFQKRFAFGLLSAIENITTQSRSCIEAEIF